VLLAWGCLDRWLRRFADGRASFAFNSGHKGVTLATSRDGCLRLRVLGNGLFLTVTGRNPAGKGAILCATRGTRWRGLSLGLTVESAHAVNERTFIVLRARLKEISLVPDGAIPECRLL
jgi:hypothetical protein